MSKSYRFGQFVLDPGRRTLSRADSPISLTPKAFDVLLFLTQNPNRLVTKEELLQAVWRDTFVEEGNLAQYIWHLRKALGDNSEDTRLIVTIARKGYQFAGDVVFSDEAGPVNQAAAQVNATERLRTDASPPSGVPKMQMVANTPGPRRKGVVGASATFLWALATGALLVVGALGVWRYEVYRHRITLAPTDTLVLADVDNRTSDPVFDGALNTALRYEMEQTPYLNLLGLDKTYATMGQMKLPPTTKITPEIARQICSKTNSKMVLADSIADAGNLYRLEIRALDCGSGATLAEEGTDISARNQVVHDLGATAARLRRKLGEPAESLARFNQPLEIALSPSLEAPQMGNEGVKLFLAGDPQAALSLCQREVELDPSLGVTYEGIGAANGALGHYDHFLRERSTFEAQQGHFDSADRLRLQASRLSSNPEDISWALVFSALRNAEAGRAIQARKAQDQALQTKLDRNKRMVLALSLARSGRTDEAERLADEVSREAPLDTTVQKYLVPTVRAAIKLRQHDPNAAIDLLREAVPYDLAFTQSFDYLYPAYIRGLAYLESGDGPSAAVEFQKLIDNPGLCWRYITGPLARLQLDRAERLMDDNVSARKSYEEFLNIWKDADRDLPIYLQGKAEYAQLKKP
jgi:DNA-binding winged helix-turn-helix (wHTH) protein